MIWSGRGCGNADAQSSSPGRVAARVVWHSNLARWSLSEGSCWGLLAVRRRGAGNRGAGNLPAWASDSDSSPVTARPARRRCCRPCCTGRHRGTSDQALMRWRTQIRLWPSCFTRCVSPNKPWLLWDDCCGTCCRVAFTLFPLDFF